MVIFQAGLQGGLGQDREDIFNFNGLIHLNI